jgi:methylated-DNA-[protein]-cysteine S-methyltransferase
VVGPARYPLWPDPHLSRYRAPARQREGGARRGAANGRNPISIIAPCHRVIGAGGELTGFAGGLHVKKLLLAIEGISTEGRDIGQVIDPRRKAQSRRREDPNQLSLL